MAELEIIDVHNHVYPTAELGRRNQEVLGRAAERQGTVEEMLRLHEENGITHAVVLCYISATRMYERRVPDLPKEPKEREKADRELKEMLTERIIRFNDWGIENYKEHPSLLPFVGVDPNIMTKEAMVNELEDKKKKDARGVKINPGNFGLYLNDPRLWPLYEFADRTGLPILTESGAGNRKVGPGIWDPPGRAIYLKYAFEEFKSLKVITAHFNRGCPPEDLVYMARKYPGFYTDLSHQLGEWGEPGEFTVEEGVAWIRKVGVDHVVFGSNYLMGDPAHYAKKLRELPMTSTELEKIASGNAKTILGIKN